MKKLKLDIKKMFNEFFTPKLPEPKVTLMSTFSFTHDNPSDTHHRQNIEAIMIADLKLQWEAQRRTLVLVQRTAIISILSLIVAIIALIITSIRG